MVIQGAWFIGFVNTLPLIIYWFIFSFNQIWDVSQAELEYENLHKSPFSVLKDTISSIYFLSWPIVVDFIYAYNNLTQLTSQSSSRVSFQR